MKCLVWQFSWVFIRWCHVDMKLAFEHVNNNLKMFPREQVCYSYLITNYEVGLSTCWVELFLIIQRFNATAVALLIIKWRKAVPNCFSGSTFKKSSQPDFVVAAKIFSQIVQSYQISSWLRTEILFRLILPLIAWWKLNLQHRFHQHLFVL